MAPEAGRVSTNLLVQERHSQHVNVNVTSNVNVPNVPSQATQLNPEARNRNLLNTMFKFKDPQGAPLKRFIHDTTKIQKNYYSLAEILTILKDVISSEKMFDERNPSVIICSKPLEAALDQKALHVTEVRDLVIQQLEQLADQSLRDPQPPQRLHTSQARPQAPRGPAQTAPPTVVRTASIATNVQTNKDTKFRLKPLFLDVVRSVDEVDHKQTIFTYEEITRLLSAYILSKKHLIFDKRNIKLALVENDPLGKAFGVTAFHRCQVNALLRTQLIPVHPDQCLVDQVSTTTTSSPSSLSVSTSEQSAPVVPAPASSSSSSPSLPPFPALEKAASLPANFSNRRKRTNSSEKSEEEGSRQQKQQRRSDQCSVVVRRSEDSENSETETIYSEQGYETIKAAEEEDEAGTSGSDMDTTREVFEVEYDIDSGEEEERPPQAHGQGQDFSSAENSDTSADEGYRAKELVTKVVESVYWADSEEEKEEKAEIAARSSKEKGKCVSCKSPSSGVLITHCTRCWDSRKQWAPERPRRKRRTKKEKAKVTTLVVPEGMDDTDGGSTAEGEIDRPRSDTMSSQDSGIGSQEFEMLELTETEVVAPPASLDLTKLGRSISLDTTSMSSSSSTSGSMTMDTSELSELGSMSDMKAMSRGAEMCMFCEMRPRNAIFIHGKLGHQVCCYPCAKKNWKTSPNCPICKRRVEKIIKAIQA